MGDKLNAFAATCAEIDRIPSMDTTAACAAARRIEPVHDPVKTIGERWSLCNLHGSAGDSIKKAKSGEGIVSPFHPASWQSDSKPPRSPFFKGGSLSVVFQPLFEKGEG